MSISQVLEELPEFSAAEKQLLIRRAIELDDAGFSPEQERLVLSRLSDHAKDPSSAVSLEEMKRSLRSEFGK